MKPNVLEYTPVNQNRHATAMQPQLRSLTSELWILICNHLVTSLQMWVKAVWIWQYYNHGVTTVP